MIKGNFNISTGGRVMSVSNDRGTTKEVVYQPKSEPAYKVADRERTQRAAAYFGNPREAALERELMKQVTGKSLSTATVTPKLENAWNQLQSEFQGINNLNRQLFKQVVDGGCLSGYELIRVSE